MLVSICLMPILATWSAARRRNAAQEPSCLGAPRSRRCGGGRRRSRGRSHSRCGACVGIVPRAAAMQAPAVAVGDAAELLDVHVDQLARPRPLVADHSLLRGARHLARDRIRCDTLTRSAILCRPGRPWSATKRSRARYPAACTTSRDATQRASIRSTAARSSRARAANECSARMRCASSVRTIASPAGCALPGAQSAANSLGER